MIFKTRFSILLILCLALALMMSTGVSAQDEMNSETTVHLFADGSLVEGAWSSLERYESGVIATLHTSALTPNDVVTMWWVVFNEPENCSDACGEDDIFLFDGAEMLIGENGAELNMEQIEAAQIALMGATGNVIPDDGSGHFSAVLSAGDNPNLVFGPALLSPMSAEIHLVLRTHGTMVTGALDAQIIAFNGGCASEWPHAPCQDVQFAVHLP